MQLHARFHNEVLLVVIFESSHVCVSVRTLVWGILDQYLQSRVIFMYHMSMYAPEDSMWCSSTSQCHIKYVTVSHQVRHISICNVIIAQSRESYTKLQVNDGKSFISHDRVACMLL